MTINDQFLQKVKLTPTGMQHVKEFLEKQVITCFNELKTIPDLARLFNNGVSANFNLTLLSVVPPDRATGCIFEQKIISNIGELSVFFAYRTTAHDNRVAVFPAVRFTGTDANHQFLPDMASRGDYIAFHRSINNELKAIFGESVPPEPLQPIEGVQDVHFFVEAKEPYEYEILFQLCHVLKPEDYTN